MSRRRVDRTQAGGARWPRRNSITASRGSAPKSAREALMTAAGGAPRGRRRSQARGPCNVSRSLALLARRRDLQGEPSLRWLRTGIGLLYVFPRAARHRARANAAWTPRYVADAHRNAPGPVRGPAITVRGSNRPGWAEAGRTRPRLEDEGLRAATILRTASSRVRVRLSRRSARGCAVGPVRPWCGRPPAGRRCRRWRRAGSGKVPRRARAARTTPWPRHASSRRRSTWPSKGSWPRGRRPRTGSCPAIPDAVPTGCRRRLFIRQAPAPEMYQSVGPGRTSRPASARARRVAETLEGWADA